MHNKKSGFKLTKLQFSDYSFNTSQNCEKALNSNFYKHLLVKHYIVASTNQTAARLVHKLSDVIQPKEVIQVHT